MSWLSTIGSDLGHAAGVGLGALEGAGNVALNVVIPQAHSPGDVFEPSTPTEEQGAQDATHLAQTLHLYGQRDPAQWTTASTQALLGSAQITAQPGQDAHVSFSATADGDSWVDAARSAAAVSVFVDGAYQSSVAVSAERTEPYDVNLGPLAPGQHQIDLRSSPSIAAAQSVAPAVSAISGYETSGEQALIDANEPIFQTRDAGNRQGGFGMTSDDSPLVVTPSVTPLTGGQSEIQYRVLLSDENFGTTATGRDRTYGRTTDYEALYDVVVGADGTPVSRWYESPEHIERTFDGQTVNGRPVVRISTGNNNASQWADGSTPLWSESALGATPAAESSVQLMLAHPWTFSVMQGEMDREHATPGTVGQVDSRRFLYLGTGTDPERAALDQDGSLAIQLTDGTTRTIMLGKASSRPDQPTTLPLPAGVTSGQVAGIVGMPAGSQAFVLDPQDRPVMLDPV